MGVRTGYGPKPNIEEIYFDGDVIRGPEESYYDGNAVRRLEDPDSYFEKRRLQKAARRRQEEARKTLLRERMKQLIGVGIGSVVVIITCLMLLSTIAESNQLTIAVEDLENQVQELSEQNDAKEYEIDSSVDLDYIVQVATNELGMVRSSAGQIQTYESDDSEYIQKSAEIPTD